jgi:23S rRNA (guanine745-N1)-methyltransferase
MNASVLTCPICAAPLAKRQRALYCAAGHSFDVSRHGYVDLLPHGHGRSGKEGDTPAMLAARTRFLDAGHYDFLRDALADAAAAALGTGAEGALLEAGCGDGYYLAGAAEAAGDAGVFGFDIAPHALRAAARRLPDGSFFVNDVSHRICMADASVACLLNVFAPRNAAEFARVTAPGGTLLVAVPAGEHLQELSPLLAIGAAPEKAASVTERMKGIFMLEEQRSLRQVVTLAPHELADLLAMTPSARHRQVSQAELPAAPVDVTASFELLTFSRA